MVWIFVLYLLYGLAFFTLGVAILSRDIRLSELGIARIIRLLAVFGIIHGFHEWLELLEQVQVASLGSQFKVFRLAVVSLSFLFLFYFGLFLNIITLFGDKALAATRPAVKACVATAALAVILFAAWLDLGSGRDVYTRMLVAFPGGMLAGIGLILYSRTVRTFSGSTATNFILAGSCMVSYAIFTGLIPSDAVIPVFGVKVIVFRGASAFLIMYFTIRALSVFNLEQRKLINDQLQRFSQSEKMTSLGILAAGIAHEINTPLTNISLNVELLKDLVGGDERVGRKIAAIERNIERASRIARELLHFSREKETALQPTSLNQVIASAFRLIEHQPLSSIIGLHLQEISEIMGIPWKLEEVFVNLLMNSLDACTDKDRIDISTWMQNNRVMVSIADTGHGIPPEHLPRVFDPFFTTKEVGRGTGLGLSVCYNIIRQHGGEIELTSVEQKGTKISISFPGAADDNGNHPGG
ncbi:MAG: GHKL domain-containing protein [Desulfobulbaceae bacterium]|nr:MAG: GHKL domain-containing protein [Desulfobulbaceae bacterium]